MEEWGDRGLTVFGLLFGEFSQPPKYAKSSEVQKYTSRHEHTARIIFRLLTTGGRRTAEVAGQTF